MILISVFIITKNEEKHIRKTLNSVKDMDEVIIVDSGSTDNTLSIAESFENVKIFHHKWQGYAKQKQYAMSLCKNEWVLNLDGDEELTPGIIEAFKKIINDNSADSVRFWRNDFFIGEGLSPLSKKPNNHRLYKKSKSFFDNSRFAHESATVDGKEIFINETFNHYGYPSISIRTDKNNTYSSLKAEEKHHKRKKHSTLKLVTIFPLTFIKEYFFQRKFFSGKRGFILSIIESYYAFLKEAKLYELYEKENKNEF
ncbi:glycosyltransferase family 2 protein [Photobacterium leiognathi]|uniref:Glycosyl transferase n=1 Tax=Photobacterium leiognathi subsp. mandapamensis TaxID=48408 RepID=A0A2T3KXV2_PHOLD|nr:glycosyltransferase family 2 protein [Photobacterium leiognathi]PSV12475.1 glycosyl transferase [Photobacterium leiognathi subsp. mandapamensis]